MSPKDYARRAKNESQKALRLDDLGRRLKEAQTLIDEHQERYEKNELHNANELRKGNSIWKNISHF